MYTDTALTSLDSTLRVIPLLPSPSRRTLLLRPNQVNMTFLQQMPGFLGSRHSHTCCATIVTATHFQA